MAKRHATPKRHYVHNGLRVWSWNDQDGFWRSECYVTPNTAEATIDTIRRKRPGVMFRVSKKRPMPPPKAVHEEATR